MINSGIEMTYLYRQRSNVSAQPEIMQRITLERADVWANALSVMLHRTTKLI